MYSTTKEFLIRFGLKDLGDLPRIEDMAEALGFDPPGGLIEQTPREDVLPLDEGDVEAEPLEDDVAKACSVLTSAPVRSRQAPSGSRPPVSGPMPVRASDRTGWPTASHIRRTWRFRPSRIVNRSVAWCPSRAALDHRDVGGQRPHAVERDAVAQPPQRGLIGHARDGGSIGALDAVSRMGELGGQVAVVGQQQQAFGVVVQPADRVDVLVHAAQQIDHGRAPLRIGPGGHEAGGLVEQDVALGFGAAHAPAVHADVVLVGVGLGAQLANGRAVDRHAAFGNQRLGGPPRRDARLRQDLLEALLHWVLGVCYRRNSDTGGPMTRRTVILALAAMAALAVSADRIGAQANPAGAAVQPFKPSDIKWVRNAAGTQETAVLFGDPTKAEPYVMRLKWLPGNMSRPHSHPNDRHFVVISGTWWLGSGEKYESGFHRSRRARDLRLSQGQRHPLRRRQDRGSGHPGVGDGSQHEQPGAGCEVARTAVFGLRSSVFATEPE